MKALAFFALLLMMTGPVAADELLKNGDFTDGRNHWIGDGMAPGDQPPDNPLATSNSAAVPNELIVHLKPHVWTRVTQQFSSDAPRCTLVIKFITSPGVRFTDRKEDYSKANDVLDLWYAEDYASAGRFMYGIIDDARNILASGLGSPDMLAGPNPSVTETMDSTTAERRKTVYLAFPPGTGTIVIRSVSLTTPN